MKRYHTFFSKGNWGKVEVIKVRITQQSTAQNVRIWKNIAWESLVTDRQEIWRSKGTRFTAGTTDSTAWKPIARTRAVVTAERKRNTTRWQRLQQANQLQETLHEVRRELQQQISRNSVLIDQQAQPRRLTIRDITLGVKWELRVALGVGKRC